MNRRTFLRSTGGAILGLPWLESLADESVNAAPNAASSPNRFVLFYTPIGVVRRGFFPGEAKAAIPKFTSNQQEIDAGVTYKPGTHPLEWTPTLEPLKPIERHITLVTGASREYQHGTDVHAQCGSCFLSSAAPNTIETSAYPLDRTLDHVLADAIGNTTPFRTLEFSCNSHKDNKESIYFDNISWHGPQSVAPSLRDPRKTYQRLFQTSRAESFRNITDLVLQDARRMRQSLSVGDKDRFNQFFDSLRALETQIEKLERMRDDLSDPGIEQPPEALLPRGDYIRLMADLMIAALETGLTNIATFMIGPERWNTPFHYEGLFDSPRSHHQMSHNQQKFVEDLMLVDRFHMEKFAYIVQRMASIQEANGQSLLDNTALTYGSGLGDGATHQYSDLPIVIAGGAQGQLTGGNHLHLSEGTPLANLWLTQARLMGIPMQRFADSDGPIRSIVS